MKTFPIYRQLDQMDCGPTCIRMVAQYYGKHYNLDTLRQYSGYSREGVSLLGISETAEKIGFRTRGVQLSYTELIKEVKQPCILHWDQNHFVVFIPSNKTNFYFSKENNLKTTIADPAKGLVTYTKKEFLNHWISDSNKDEEPLGVALLLEPTPDFYKQKGEKRQGIGWSYLLGYVWQQKGLFFQLSVGLLLGTLLSLVTPFITQNIVDVGISNQNIGFIYIMLIAQTCLFFGRTIIEFIRSRVLLYISTRINLNILSDFWIKLTKLPLSFFDTKMTGDIMQRIGDHKRIEGFLTNNTLNVLFSLFNFILYTIILLYYNPVIFGIFAAGSALYYLWVNIFLKYRRKLDYERFAISSKENTATMQLINGMQEIKLNGAEQIRRWEWENLQTKVYQLSFKSLSINQIQQAGAFFINEGKNILVTFFVAKAVVDGYLTLGQMMAVQFIIGQLNAPIEQLIGFIQQAQDAKISLERLNEIHSLTDEESIRNKNSNQENIENKKEKDKQNFVIDDDAVLLQYLPIHKTITFENIVFSYAGAGNEPVLNGISCVIPENKVTAIVGASGSGKTTLLKLLLRFYENYSGKISVGGAIGKSIGDSGGMRLAYISPKYWRSKCGSVMQDGYIFNDSIAKNIAVSDEVVNFEKLLHACTVANILPFIEGLPLGFNTKIGAEGNGISQGQKQRLLIARAVYKNPEYLFFDEATNALDANNEKEIMEQLQVFFKEKTVIVVAHRLSTVKNADNILVLDKGTIIEQGTHEALTQLKGVYYTLVKNQLELGN